MKNSKKIKNSLRLLNSGVTPLIEQSQQQRLRPMQRRLVSRRSLLGATVGASSLILGSGSRSSGIAQGVGSEVVDPKPIPGGITIFDVFIHHFPPALGMEPSEITDFDGFVADTRITRMGTGMDTKSNVSTRLLYQADMGFMKGIYIGVDGQRHRGTFGFI